MSVSDENVPSRRDIYGGRRIELVWSAARDAGLAKRHQDFAVRTELNNLLPFAGPPQVVGCPYVASVINMKAMRQNEHAGAKALHQPARRIELENGVKAGSIAREGFARLISRWWRERAATFCDPHARPVWVDIDTGGRTPGPPFRQFGPVVDRAVWIGRRIRCRTGLGERQVSDPQHEGNAYSQHDTYVVSTRHDGALLYGALSFDARFQVLLAGLQPSYINSNCCRKRCCY